VTWVGSVAGVRGRIASLLRAALVGTLCVVTTTISSAVALPLTSAAAAATTASNAPFRGLGAWVDVFDYAPRLQADGTLPTVTVDSVDDMARLGARTLYLQVANPDDAPADTLVDRTEISALVRRAHDRGMSVVAWFLPYVSNVDADDEFVRQVVQLRSGGRGFDALALDIEDTKAVPDVQERNQRVVTLAKRARRAIGSNVPLAAIVYPAVQLDVVNPILWPDFPYKKLQPSIDVWMPMAYFTFRDEESGYRDAYKYTKESVTRLRTHLDDDRAVVHPVGGIADQVTSDDLDGFLRAARATGAIGWSLYDYATTFSTAWPALRRVSPSA